tara:strand:- start:2120 stop:2935 length:816 start_codon:yes stop_codon:yes gene_type:complete
MNNTNMKVNEVVAIIDRSGSMQGKVADSVGGFNSTLQILREQKEDDTKINVSVKIFDNEEHMIIRSLPLSDVRQLEERQIVPRGQTALLDAMGNTLTYFMEKKLIDPSAYDCCTIYIVTDGLENCSRTFTQNRIKELVKSGEDKYNIKVIYLAANQDAILEAGNLGITPGQAINYSETSAETDAAYRSVAAMVGRHHSGVSVEFLQAERNASQRSPPTTPTRSFTQMNEPPPIVRQTCAPINVSPATSFTIGSAPPASPVHRTNRRVFTRS